MIRSFARAGLVLGAALALAACGSSTTEAPSSAPSAAPSAAPSSAPLAGPSEAPSSAPSEAPSAVCAQAAADADFAAAVTIGDFAMSPDPVTIRVGETIAWTNQDAATHTATLESGDCTTDSLSQGETGKLTFSVAGSYTYKCAIHSGQMNGFRIEVTSG